MQLLGINLYWEAAAVAENKVLVLGHLVAAHWARLGKRILEKVEHIE